MESLRIESLSTKNWAAFEQLFGKKGACGGCWCMYFRMKSADWKASNADTNYKNMQTLVRNNQTTGLLVFDGEQAVGWCAISPRKEYVKLATARMLQPIDDQEVWSIPCFFIHKDYRGKGISRFLINGAIQWAKENDIHILEAYPTRTDKRQPDTFMYYGVANVFERCGFKIVREDSPSRPMMRYYLT